MDALAGTEFGGRAALVEDVLVLADLHVGKAAAANVDLPVGEGREMVERFRALCDRFAPREVVIAGDMLHSFESVPRLVEETLDGLRSVAENAGIEIVVTPGNHDTMLDVVWGGRTTPEYRIGETLVCHGHVEPAGEADRYILGHDHPTITIEGQTHPCYLAGDVVYRGSDLLVLPSFNRLVPGVEINEMSTADFLSPLVRDADALAPLVCPPDGDDVLSFPPLGEFRHKL
jgi:putative SbcD/Mre11-related phosphoesterase